MITTTLNRIRKHFPCESSWVELLESLDKTKADDEPLSMVHILDTLGMDDCFWAMRSLPEYDREWRLLACACAEAVLSHFEDKYPKDDRPRKCIEVSRAFANGEATQDEMVAARDAADAAADAAGDAARDAADAAADAAGDYSWYAAGDAWYEARTAGGAAGKEQESQLRKVLTETESRI